MNRPIAAARPRLPAARPAGNAGERRRPDAVRPAAGPLGRERGQPGRARVPRRPARHAVRQRSRPRRCSPCPAGAPPRASTCASTYCARRSAAPGDLAQLCRHGGTAARAAARPLAAAVQRARHRRPRVRASSPSTSSRTTRTGTAATRSNASSASCVPSPARSQPPFFAAPPTGSAAGRPAAPAGARHRRRICAAMVTQASAARELFGKLAARARAEQATAQPAATDHSPGRTRGSTTG